jgi:glycosyltransferase involved in cell wall biosynthesis
VRIVAVSAWEPWRTTDGAAFILDHQLRLLASRHDITLLAAGAPEAQSPPPSSIVRTLPGVDVRWFGTGRGRLADQVTRRVWSRRHREPAHVGFVERPDLVTALRQVVADGVDVVHLHGWGTARLWACAGDAATVHMAVDPWAVNASNRRLPAVRRVLDREQQGVIAAHERTHYPKLGAVVVVTPRDAAALRDVAPGARVEVIANGVDPGPQPSPIDGDNVLGFHGVFDSQANVDAARNLVEQVLPRVRRTVPGARVRLVGRRPPREIAALAGDGVAVVADAPDLRAELDRMTVHVDWMTSGTGIKNKVLEAMAAGRPVVASSLGAEGIGVGAGLIVAADLDAVAVAIVGLLTDLPTAAATGADGRARVLADFSWQTNADRLESLWSELAHGGAA